MNGQLALLGSLAAYGGRWLRGGGATSDLASLQANSSFQYVASFSATLPAARWRRRQLTVQSPEAWLTALRSQGTRQLTLVTDLGSTGPLPPQVASAFSNAGTWALLADGRRAALWQISWAVEDPDEPQSRIWRLTASATPAPRGMQLPRVSPGQARDELRAALTRTEQFARHTEELEGWAGWFAAARRLLDDPEPAAPYVSDILPPDAPLERRQLVAAVVQGWVFGGMGSWNDVGPMQTAQQRTYEAVSAGLYTALLTAFPAAVNDV